MLASMDSPSEIWRKRAVVMLLLAVLLQGVTSTSDLASTLNVRKCNCNGFQAWDGVQCIDAETALTVYNGDIDVQDGINYEKIEDFILTSTVQNVTVMNLECPNNLLSITLQQDFLLLPDGRLLFLRPLSVFGNDEYCIEHVIFKGNIYLDALVCMAFPAVPRCCPANHTLQQDGSCHPHQDLHAPPLQLGTHALDWDAVTGEMGALTCSEHEYYRYIPLIGKTKLLATPPTATLEWTPPFWMALHDWKHRYCVGVQEMEGGELQYMAQICFKDHNRYHKRTCKNNSCIRKCCPENQLLSPQKWCVEGGVDEVWRPWQNSSDQLKFMSQNSSDQLEMVTGEPGCNSYFHYKKKHLLANGSLQLGQQESSLHPSMYCLDNQLEHDGSINAFALICFPPEPTDCIWRDIMMKVMLGVSCVFLLATLAVYLGVPELRDHTYGRCLISLVTAMLTTYISIMIKAESTNRDSCYVLAFIKHLSGLAMFFWLNVMCFDMWKILRGTLMQYHSVKVFLGYSLYAWGCPLLVCSIALILDLTAPDNIILPEFYDGGCWFRYDQAYWAYFSGFILLLVVVNIGFFTHIAWTLYWKMKQRAQEFETTTSRTNRTTKTKHQVWLFTKLFVVMGVVWIADVLSSVSHRNTCNYYWLVTDIINGLQGVLIFIVAVCNKDNLKKMKDAWQPRVQAMRRLSVFPGQTSQKTTNTLSVEDTESSRKTSITSLPRKLSQASSMLFSAASRKTATLNPSDPSSNSHSGRKSSNVSVKDVIPLSTMPE